MREVSDIDLMRLADGTLEEPRLSMVEAEVAVRPDLQEQLEAYLVTGKALAQLFIPIAEARVPERLLATIRPAAADPYMPHRTVPRRHAPGTVRRGRDWLAALLRPDWRLSPMAAAAALTCVAAIGAAIMLTEPHQDTLVGDAPRALASALDKVPSATKVAIGLAGSDEATFTPELSFQHRDGRYCRQYYLGVDQTRAFVGFACSEGNGQWRIEMNAAAPVRVATTKGDIRPSEEGPTVRAVEDAMTKVMVGDALEIVRERALIQQGWPREKQ
jgi:hypothetical protein